MSTTNRSRIRFGSSLAILFLAASPTVQAAKNVILFIGDGMGFEHVRAAACYNGAPLCFEGFPAKGDVTTYSANSSITDSAAAATAIATGFKVNNDVVSVALPGDGRDLETMLELFKKRGKATGLITTTYPTHATPAGFGAHESSRNNTAAIGNDLLTQSQPNILFGGGDNGITPALAAAQGYSVATTTSGFNGLDPSASKLCALFGSGYLPFEEDYLGREYPYPHLREMVTKALDALEEDPDGFFLMVEGGKIDTAAHSNWLPETVHETLEFSRAVQVALNWVTSHPDTLIIVTSDHETGGLKVTADKGALQYPSVTWSTTGHTGLKVPVYATGPSSELLQSVTMDNTHFLRVVTLEGTAPHYLYRVSVQDITDSSATIVWSTDEPATSMVEVRQTGTTTWITAQDPTLATTHAVAVTSLVKGTSYEYRVSSENAAGDTTSSAIYSFQAANVPSAPLVLVNQGAVWKYNDKGTDLGTAWRGLSYSDAAWAEGKAPLGYGAYATATTVSYGGDATRKYITYYFRRTFSIADPAAYSELRLSLWRDDGAVVYLNGTEVHRVNMPAGAISFSTFASTAADYVWDTPVSIDRALLVPGDNVLAVEIHQASATSSDIVMDCKLEAADANDVQIVKGPWLQNVTESSMVVMWETDGATGSRVDYGVGNADEFQVADNAPTTLHKVTLTGLLPNTIYRYTVASGYAVSTESTFQTAPSSPDESYRFVVYSDTQVASGHQAVINSIMADNPPPRFVLHAGDQTDYGRTYSYWGTTFFTPAAPLLRKAPVYPALGNHEYAGTERMWFFDFFDLPANGTGFGAEQWYAFTYGSVRIVALDTISAFAPGSEQYNWLVSELQSLPAQRATWRVVFFHHPPFPEQVPGLEAYLVPLFHQYGVHLVFNGHIHSYRHIYRVDPAWQTRVDYLTVGGGGSALGAPLALPNDSSLTLVAQQQSYHHCILDVSPGSLALKVVDNAGAAIENFTLYNIADMTPPVISDLTARNIGETAASISWTTSENADSKVLIRIKDGSDWITTTDAAYVTAHNMPLTGLTASTTYDYMVVSVDPAGNDASSAVQTFTTRVPNTLPVAVSQAITLVEDTQIYVELAATDANGDPLTYRITAGPEHGTLTQNPPTVLYTLAPNYNGEDSFQFVANDGVGDSPAATITITVTPVNDPPVAANQAATVLEDTPTVIQLAASDVDGDELTWSYAQPGHGTLSGTAPNLTYNPDANYSGPDSFSYTVQDAALAASATVSITVTPVNDRPVADPQSVAVTEDVACAITLSGSDPEGSSLTFAVVTGPEHGSLSGTAPNLLYTPAVNFFGADSFTYKANDGSLDSSPATVIITVSAVPDAPTANPDAATTLERVPVIIAVLANDTDPDSASLQVSAVGTPAHGSAVLNPDHTVTYRSVTGYTGDDTFTYTLSDGSLTAQGTVTVTVKPNILFSDGFESGNFTAGGWTFTGTAAVDAAAKYSGSYGALLKKTASITKRLTGEPSGTVKLSYWRRAVALDPGESASVYRSLDGQTWTLIETLVGTTSWALIETDLPTTATDLYIRFTLTSDAGKNLFMVDDVTVAGGSPPNHAPSAQVDSFSVAEDGVLTVSAPGVLANDSDPDGDILTATLVSGPAEGLVLNSDGSFTYSPPASFNGQATFSYTASDGLAESAPAIVTINVAPVNDAPTATPTAVTLQEDTAGTIQLLANDVDGDPLTYSFTQPSHGTVAGSGSTVTYTPAANYFGPDTFSFTVSDGSASVSASVSVTVESVNDSPVANADTATTAEDTAVTIEVLANDSDFENESLTVTAVSQGSHGSAAIDANGTVSYLPNANFHGTDSFSYTLEDGTGGSASATVTVTVTPVNDAPVARNDAHSVEQNSTLTVAAPGLLSNDSDADADTLTAELTTGPTQGTLAMNADGSFVYTPFTNWTGTDSFTYTVADGTLPSEMAAVIITVHRVNNEPVAVGETSAINEDGSVTFTLSGTDADNDPLTYTIQTGPSHGVLSGTAPSLTYTPAANFSGSDSFSFTVSDGLATSAPATVTITVIRVNDPPVAQSQSTQVLEDGSVAVTLTATDVDGDSLIYTEQEAGPAHGTLSGTPPKLTYTPVANYFGADSFTFTVTDGTEISGVATVTITVLEVNDPPNAVDQDLTVSEDGSVSIELIGTDADGDALSYQVAAGPAHGSLSGTAPNLTYTPAANYHGSDSFTFSVSDGRGGSGTGSVLITINPANDPPAAQGDAYSVDQGGTLTVSAPGVLANDLDIDQDNLSVTATSTPANGTVVFGADGSFTYTPNTTFTGTDSFTYTVSDGQGGTATATVTVDVITQTPPPAAPTSLRAAGITSSQVSMTWLDNSANEQGFIIERSSDGSTYVEHATVSAGATSFTDTGLTRTTRYFYRVRAFNAGGYSAYSNVLNVKTSR